MPLKTHQDEQPSLNLTPMIDIVFLLIIFFMVGSKFTELSEVEQNIPLEVPTVANAGAMTERPSKRLINVFRDGSIELDRQQVSLAELEELLRKSRDEYPKMGVIVRGDSEGRFQNVANVLATCRAAGIANFAISVQVESSVATSAQNETSPSTNRDVRR